jgi:HK97 family phage major capsid protein
MSEELSAVSRSFNIERLAPNGGKVVYRASLSSETPVKDFPYLPPVILRHTDDAINLKGINERGIPLVANHGMFDKGIEGIHNVIGRIKKLRIEAKRLVGDFVFSEANPNAALVRAMVDEETLTDMSITSTISRARRIEVDGQEFMEALSWMPIEASVVGSGGDQVVGIGRSNQKAVIAEETEMSDEAKVAADEKAAGTEIEEKTLSRIAAGKQQHDDNFAAENEAKRRKAIGDLCKMNGVGEETQREWIARGYALDRVADDLLKIFEERGKSSPLSISALGINDNEARQYSLCRAIVAAHTKDWRQAGFELECHETIASKTDKPQTPGVFYVPLEVQRRSMSVPQQTMSKFPHLQRDLTAGTASAGGYLVQTSVMGFDELLRNISVCFRAGATRLSGLRDSMTIPRQSAAATAEWLTGEADSAAESQPAFVQLAMSPKTVSAYTELSRKLLLQSSIDVEGLVNADLAAVTALAVDVAGLRGTGATGQPLGLDNVTGVGAVSGASIDLDAVLESQTDVATANVMPMSGGYVTTPAVAAILIATVAYTSTASPLWNGNIWSGTMQGFPSFSSNQVASATMYFGDWSKMVIGEWGVLEVDTNPYANFGAGIIGIRAMYSVDVGVRYPAAFSITTSIS